MVCLRLKEGMTKHITKKSKQSLVGLVGAQESSLEMYKY